MSEEELELEISTGKIRYSYRWSRVHMGGYHLRLGWSCR